MLLQHPMSLIPHIALANLLINKLLTSAKYIFFNEKNSNKASIKLLTKIKGKINLKTVVKHLFNQ